MTPDELKGRIAQVRAAHREGLLALRLPVEDLCFFADLADKNFPAAHAFTDNDKAIYDHTKLPAFVRSFLAINSLSAVCTVAIREAGHMPKLFARYHGTPVQVTLVSRLGDVGITTDLSRERGYDERVSIFDLDCFSQTPLQPHTEEDGA